VCPIGVFLPVGLNLDPYYGDCFATKSFCRSRILAARITSQHDVIQNQNSYQWRRRVIPTCLSPHRHSTTDIIKNQVLSFNVHLQLFILSTQLKTPKPSYYDQPSRQSPKTPSLASPLSGARVPWAGAHRWGRRRFLRPRANLWEGDQLVK
jgi:hypothetical protein